MMAVSHDVFISECVHVCVCFLLKDTWENLKKNFKSLFGQK